MNITAMVWLLILAPMYVLAVGFKLWAVSGMLYKWNFPLSRIPGSKMASWTRFWWVRLVSRSQLDRDMRRLHREYGMQSRYTVDAEAQLTKIVGPVVRIAPNSILISDPNTTQDVLAVGSRFKRGPWFDSLRLDPFIPNVVSERDPKNHQQLRAILAPGVGFCFNITVYVLIDVALWQ